uniref:Protein 4 n=1 Tax=Ophrys virus 1 TaxID=2977977 RepID=A0A9N7AB48_9RHAB|nr:TPA_asm: protein 4 [Ophrys virus 1]
MSSRVPFRQSYVPKNKEISLGSSSCNDTETKIIRSISQKICSYKFPNWGSSRQHDWRELFRYQRVVLAEIKSELTKITSDQGCRYHDYGEDSKRLCVKIQVILYSLEKYLQSKRSQDLVRLRGIPIPHSYICWSCIRLIFISDDSVQTIQDNEERRKTKSFPAPIEEFETSSRVYDPRYGVMIEKYAKDPEINLCDSSSDEGYYDDLKDEDLSL